MKAAGGGRVTPVEQVAELVADGIAADRFWRFPESEHSDRQIRARSQSMLDRANPAYLESFILDRLPEGVRTMSNQDPYLIISSTATPDCPPRSTGPIWTAVSIAPSTSSSAERQAP